MDDKLLQNEPPMPAQAVSTARVLWWFFGGALALFLFFYAIRPLSDPDLWWHLKTGEVMIQNGGWLQSDPFSYAGDGVVSAREALILKGYWLWQLTAYGLYALLGFNGIFLLNLLTIGTLAGVVVQQLRRQQVNSALAALLLSLGFYLLRATYPLERPQVLSFLLATILLALLARVREGGELGWTLPLLMLLWANLHGGFVVGDLILLCFSVGAVLEYRHDLPRLRHLLTWSSVALAASLLNPTGALVFSELFTFHGSVLLRGVTEYQSTWVIFQRGDWSVVILWLLIGLYGVGVWRARRLYWPDLIVALFLAVFSVAYLRNMAFFAVAMLPSLGFYLQQGVSRRQGQLPTFVSGLLLTLCATLLLVLSYQDWQEREGAGPVKLLYPEQAITFLRASGLQGRMFNSYEYGGYLLWRLFPSSQVFIDGRGLEERVFIDCQKLLAASPTRVDGRSEYEGLLDRYRIDYVFQRIYDNNGRIQPLMKSLLNNPEWVPVYLDDYVYILVRRNAKNAEVITAYRMDHNDFKKRLLRIFDGLCQYFPQKIAFQVGRAELLLFLGRYDEANAQVAAVAAAAPHNPFLPGLQRDLEILRGRMRRGTDSF